MSLAPAVVTALALLVFAPPLESAFHTPKAVVLAAGLLAVLPSVARAWRRLPVAPLVFLAAVSVSATWNDAWEAPSTTVLLLGGVTLTAWQVVDLDRDRTARVLGVALVVVCGLVVLQTFGVATFGASGRMTRSSTLGNPDFVASAVAGSVWLCWPLPRRVLGGLVALVVLALAFTQSFATIASLGAGVVFLLAHPSLRSTAPTHEGARASRRWLLAGALVIGGVLTVGVAGRDLATSLRGRWYLTKVGAPHVLDAPLTGLGPGAVELHWPRWELDWWTARCGEDAACVQQHPDFRFNGLQDHAHDDWLEAWLEAGVLGFLGLLLVSGRALRDAWRLPQPFVGAGLVVVLSRALVDFPLHRPADWAVLALLCCAARAPWQAAPPTHGD